MKKLFALLTVLSLLLLCGCGAKEGNGNFSGGSGTEEDPYLISTADDLWELASLVNADDSQENPYVSACYQMTGDIDLGGTTQWVPIDSFWFSGTFDGNGYTISGLYIDYTDPLVGENTSYFGLFGQLREGTLKNLTISDSSIAAEGDSSVQVGAMAAYIWDAVIENCHTTDSVSVTSNYYAGGICSNMNDGSSISGCSNAASVEGTGNVSKAAGIVAYASGMITDCSNSGDISCVSDAAGIAVTANSGVADCTNSGDVTASGYAGGIVCSFSDGALNSSMNDASVTLERCTNTGDITSKRDPAGGIAAYCRTGSVVDCSNSGTVTSPEEVGGILGYFQTDPFGTACEVFTVSGCTNSGTVSSNDPATARVYDAGGICGKIYECSTELIFENCENSGAVDSYSASGGIVGGCTVETIQLTGCTNTGDITGLEYSGGIVGHARVARTEEGTETSLIADSCVNSGKIHVTNTDIQVDAVYAGGILGHHDQFSLEDAPFTTVTIEKCINRGEITTGSGINIAYADDICRAYTYTYVSEEKKASSGGEGGGASGDSGGSGPSFSLGGGGGGSGPSFSLG